MKHETPKMLAAAAVAVGALTPMVGPATAKGDFPVAMAAYDESMWVAHAHGRVVRHDPLTGQPLGGIRARTTIHDMEAAAGTLWMLTTEGGNRPSTRLRPVSPDAGAAITLRGGPYCNLATSQAALMAVSCSGRRLVRIEPATRTVVTLRPPPGRITDVVHSGDHLWLALRQPRVDGRNQGTVVAPVNPATGVRRGNSVPVGRHGARLAAADRQLWAASGDGQLTAIDADTSRINYRAIVGMRAHDLAATGAEVWISASRFGRRGTLIAIAGGRRREVSVGRSGDPLQVAIVGSTVWAAGYRFTADGTHPRLWRVDAVLARDGQAAEMISPGR